MKIAIGCDHAGVEVKSAIIELLEGKGYSMIDKGPFSTESVDYPDYGHQVAEAVESKEADLGVVICGSGNGINMTVNKHQGIRGALCWLPEIASLARQHNDANIIAIPARFLSQEEINTIITSFFEAEFEGGRHGRRVNKISCA
jgi:ribose 5-phosphate isomerase B